MKGQKKVLPLKMSKNYTEKEKTHMRSSFSKLVLVFLGHKQKKYENCNIYAYAIYKCESVCVRHLNGKAAAAAVDLKFFYHICQIRIYAPLLCLLMEMCLWVYMLCVNIYICVCVCIHVCVACVCLCLCLRLAFLPFSLTFISILWTSFSRFVSSVICKFILINLIKFHGGSINRR